MADAPAALLGCRTPTPTRGLGLADPRQALSLPDGLPGGPGHGEVGQVPADPGGLAMAQAVGGRLHLEAL